jgi:hypothetical protein
MYYCAAAPCVSGFCATRRVEHGHSTDMTTGLPIGNVVAETTESLLISVL